MICGNVDHFPYRTGRLISEFFEDCGLSLRHDGSTRRDWVARRLHEILSVQHQPDILPVVFQSVLSNLLDRSEAQPGDPTRQKALAVLNAVLNAEGWLAFADPQGGLHLHRLPPPRSGTDAAQLALYLDQCSEDEFIQDLLLPVFRCLGFQRVTVAGHRDKALEYGKDVWMKFVLPTQHVLYFGIQAKKGRIDAAGRSGRGASNIAEILNQALMMLGHEIFDPELNRRVLVDHAFVVAGGEITKQARNWLGERLDASRRSQLMFIAREDILALCDATRMPTPQRDAG